MRDSSPFPRPPSHYRAHAGCFPSSPARSHAPRLVSSSSVPSAPEPSPGRAAGTAVPLAVAMVRAGDAGVGGGDGSGARVAGGGAAGSGTTTTSGSVGECGGALGGEGLPSG